MIGFLFYNANPWKFTKWYHFRNILSLGYVSNWKIIIFFSLKTPRAHSFGIEMIMKDLIGEHRQRLHPGRRRRGGTSHLVAATTVTLCHHTAILYIVQCCTVTCYTVRCDTECYCNTMWQYMLHTSTSLNWTKLHPLQCIAIQLTHWLSKCSRGRWRFQHTDKAETHLQTLAFRKTLT